MSLCHLMLVLFPRHVPLNQRPKCTITSQPMPFSVVFLFMLHLSSTTFPPSNLLVLNVDEQIIPNQAFFHYVKNPPTQNGFISTFIVVSTVLHLKFPSLNRINL
ncbi:hypothetical protein CsSME_00024011 [Camellia sinensis var. sinensis]